MTERKPGSKKAKDDMVKETTSILCHNIGKALRYDTGGTPRELAFKNYAAKRGLDVGELAQKVVTEYVESKILAIRMAVLERLVVIAERHGDRTQKFKEMLP